MQMIPAAPNWWAHYTDETGDMYLPIAMWVRYPDGSMSGIVGDGPELADVTEIFAIDGMKLAQFVYREDPEGENTVGEQAYRKARVDSLDADREFYQEVIARLDSLTQSIAALAPTRPPTSKLAETLAKIGESVSWPQVAPGNVEYPPKFMYRHREQEG